MILTPARLTLEVSGTLTASTGRLIGLLNTTVSPGKEYHDVTLDAELFAATPADADLSIRGRAALEIDERLSPGQPIDRSLATLLQPRVMRLYGGASMNNDAVRLATVGPWSLTRPPREDAETTGAAGTSDAYQLSGGSVKATLGDGDMILTATGVGNCDLQLFARESRCALPAVLTLTAGDVAARLEFPDLGLQDGSNAWVVGGSASTTVTQAGENVATGTFSVDLSPAVLALTGADVTLMGVGPFELAARHNIETGAGEGTASANQFRWPRDLAGFTITAGSRSLAAQIAWSEPSLDALTVTATLNAGGAELRHQRVVADGVSLRLALAGWPQLVTTEPARFAAAQIDAGLAIGSPVLEFDLEINPLAGNARLLGRSLTATILGGTVASDSYTLLLPELTGHANVTVTALDLQRLLSVEDRGFVATGQLSGSVPVQINSGQWTVAGGSLAAIAPGGFLRYAPDSAAAAVVAGSQELAMVAAALSDFRFYDLDVEVDYGADGTLNARTALKGSNPDFQQGREVHLNVNVEENLGDLLRSLTIGDKLTEDIDVTSPPNN